MGPGLRSTLPGARALQVVLVHGGSEVLPQFDPLLRVRALEALETRRVRVMLHTRVMCIHSPQRMEIKQKRFGATDTGGKITWEG